MCSGRNAVDRGCRDGSPVVSGRVSAIAYKLGPTSGRAQAAENSCTRRIFAGSHPIYTVSSHSLSPRKIAIGAVFRHSSIGGVTAGLRRKPTVRSAATGWVRPWRSFALYLSCLTQQTCEYQGEKVVNFLLTGESEFYILPVVPGYVSDMTQSMLSCTRSIAVSRGSQHRPL